MTTNTQKSRIFKVRMDAATKEHGIGLEVHVDGWGCGPFFTVRGFDGENALLSTRYSRSVKYRVPYRRCYFTIKCGKYFQKKTSQ